MTIQDEIANQIGEAHMRTAAADARKSAKELTKFADVIEAYLVARRGGPGNATLLLLEVLSYFERWEDGVL
jgi:hypothetical protein